MASTRFFAHPVSQRRLGCLCRLPGPSEVLTNWVFQIEFLRKCSFEHVISFDKIPCIEMWSVLRSGRLSNDEFMWL